MVFDLPFKKNDEGAACPEAHKSDTDDEIRKVVPVLYGEHLYKEDLVGNEGGRYQKDGGLNTL